MEIRLFGFYVLSTNYNYIRSLINEEELIYLIDLTMK